MRTNERLTNAYETAKKLDIDETSRLVFFSDTHRGDDSISDEFTRNQSIMLAALNYYDKERYTYIEVGDGDELWEHPNFKHIRSAHTDIFTQLKHFYEENRMILLYGNHNIYLKNKEYVKQNYYQFYDQYKEQYEALFPGIEPVEALVLHHKKTEQQILVVHGHQGDTMNDQLWFINMFFLRYFWRFMHLVGFKNPSSPAKNQYKRHKIEKRYIKWIEKHKMMMICGHTHRLKYPKKGQLPYFNIGCAIHTKGVTCLEIIKEEVMIVQWRMLADNDGYFRIKRNIIRGPEKLTKFDLRKLGK